MYYEKMTRYKTKVNMIKYNNDIRKIFDALLKEDITFENYDLYKEDYDIFINNIIGKIVSLKEPPMIIEETPDSELMNLDKKIFIKPKERTIIGMMKKI